MSGRGCDECDGQGFVFKHLDGDVLMEACPACGHVVDRGHNFKGFWLSVGWKPTADSPPGSKEWSVRLIEESTGRATLRPLDPEQLAEICSNKNLSLSWKSIVTLTSEVARLQRRLDLALKALCAGGVAIAFAVLTIVCRALADGVGR